MGRMNNRSPRPRIFEQFMTNVMDANMNDIILPLSTTSIVGFHSLRRLQRHVDIPLVNSIYLDSSHLKGETLIELEAAWEILMPGGILFGDDFDVYWQDMTDDIRKFALSRHDEVEIFTPNDLIGVQSDTIKFNV